MTEFNRIIRKGFCLFIASGLLGRFNSARWSMGVEKLSD